MNLKANMDLGYINKYMKLKFSMYVESNNKNVLNKLHFEGNNYIQYTPLPMVVLEIFSEGDKKDTIWNSNRVLNFTKYSRFIFCKRLKGIISNIKQEKELYFLEEGRLIINKQMAENMIEYIPVGQKVCTIMPTVVEDNQTHELFEGIIFIINNSEYCKLTFEEAEYLAEYLKSIDFDKLSLDIINNSLLIDIHDRITYNISQLKLAQIELKKDIRSINNDHKKTLEVKEDEKNE